MASPQLNTACPMSQINSMSNKIIAYLDKTLLKKYGNNKPLRAVHAKSIGFAKARLKVEDKLADHLKVGLFKEPNKTYEARIRFTNGASTSSADDKIAVRGMAIKVLVSGNFEDTEKEKLIIQDIILSNSKTFVPALTSLQLDAIKVAAGNRSEIFNAIPIFFRYFKAALAFLKNRIQTPNILEEVYYSGTPYSFGEHKIIKWRATPLKTITSVMPDKDHDDKDFLRARLKEDLLKSEVSFKLFVQFHKSKKTEPIDDCTVVWKTKFHHVATITLLEQDIDEIEELDDKTSFSPGHAIPEHAPCGNVNLIRAKVYEDLAKKRLAHPL